MRLFFAAMLPEPIQAKLGRLRHQLEWLPLRPAWTAPANLHVTLKFLGEVPDAQVNDVSSAGREALPPLGPLSLHPDHLIFFPPAGSARVLGVGFSGDTQKVLDIQSAIEAACERLGFPRENRPFTAHATLARFRDGLPPVYRPKIEKGPARRLLRPVISGSRLCNSCKADCHPRARNTLRWPHSRFSIPVH